MYQPTVGKESGEKQKNMKQVLPMILVLTFVVNLSDGQTTTCSATQGKSCETDYNNCALAQGTDQFLICKCMVTYRDCLLGVSCMSGELQQRHIKAYKMAGCSAAASLTVHSAYFLLIGMSTLYFTKPDFCC
jgi:hypothetical protein